jgi:hypothetical protein
MSSRRQGRSNDVVDKLPCAIIFPHDAEISLSIFTIRSTTQAGVEEIVHAIHDCSGDRVPSIATC